MNILISYLAVYKMRVVMTVVYKSATRYTYDCWHTQCGCFGMQCQFTYVCRYYTVMINWIYAPVSASVITVYVSVVIITIEYFDNHYVDGIYTVAVLLWYRMYAFHI